MTQRRGFTLIELLVVIAIIAILAAILFPVFAQAKVAAKKSVAVSHTKQITLAGLMYSADYDDVFPLAYQYPHAGPGGGFPYVLSVFPYVRNVDIYVSPAGKPNPVTNVDWDYIWSYGVIPDAQVKQFPYYVVGNNVAAQAFGIAGARYNGILGWGQNGNVWGCWGDYCSVWPGVINVPSKSQTSVARVAEQAFVFDAGEPFADHVTSGRDGEGIRQDPLFRCAALRRTYNPGAWSLAGATPRWGGPTSCTNWVPYPAFHADYPVERAESLKQGRSVVSFADGHVSTMTLSGLYATVPCDGGANRCLKHFWPTE